MRSVLPAARPAQHLRVPVGPAACAVPRLAAGVLAVLLGATCRPPFAQAAPPAAPIAWSAQLGAPIYVAPRAGAQRVLIASTQPEGWNLFALDRATGRPAWRFATGGAIQKSPTVAGGQVFVASDIGATHFMRALDAATGQMIWHYARTQPPECMCSHDTHMAGKLLLAQTDGHSLYAFAPTGRIPSRRVWQFRGDGARLTAPVEAGGLVVFGSADHDVYALDAKTGAVRWRAVTGYGFVAAPMVADGIVVIGNRGGTLHAYDLASGKPRWSFMTNGPIDSAVARRGRTVYLTSEDRSLSALTLGAGKQLWQARMADYTDFAPVLAGPAVIVANRAGELRAYAATGGKPLWSAALGGTPFSAPTPWHGAVVLKIGDHAVAAFAQDSGRMLWRYASDAVLTAPVPGERLLYVASSTGRVVALR